jgi:hypothetical protein
MKVAQYEVLGCLFPSDTSRTGRLMADWIVRLFGRPRAKRFPSSLAPKDFRGWRDGRVFRTIFPALRTGLFSKVPPLTFGPTRIVIPLAR